MKKLLQLDQVSIKNRPKSDQHKLLQLDQNSIKNRHKSDQHKPKIGQKSGQNRSKIGSGRTKIGPKSAPGPAKTNQKHKNNNEPRSTWERYFIFGQNVANMAATWPPKRAKIVKKIDPKIDQILSCFWDRVWTPKSFQKRHQKWSKIDPKSISRAIIAQKHASSFWPTKTNGFCTFFIPQEVPNRSKIDPKSVQKLMKKSIHKNIDFGSDFGSILEPSWEPKSTKNRSKKASKKQCKKEWHMEAQKSAKRTDYSPGPRWSGPQGRG